MHNNSANRNGSNDRVMTRLLDLVSLPTGQVDPTKGPYPSWPLIAPDHIEGETGRTLRWETAEEQGAISGKYHFLPGDVLYSKIRPYLRKATLADREGLCSADMYPLRANSQLDPRFLLAVVLGQEFTRFAISVSERSGLPKINRQELGEYYLALPPLEYQKRISTILEAIDSAINQTYILIDKLKAMKAGLLHDLLTKGIDENGELRDPVAHPERFKESPLGRLPKAWEVRRLAEITLSAIDGPFGSNLKTEHYVDQPGIRVVRLQNIGQGHFEDTDKAYISEKHAETLKRYRVVPGDLIIASLGDENHPIARACVYPADEQPGIVKADCFRFRLDISKALHEYLMYVLSSPWTRTDVPAVAQGVTRDRVNLTNVKKIRLRVPPASEQSHIVDIVKSLDSRLISEESDLDKLRQIKKGLTEDLLTGRIRVENPSG